ncbi:type IV pilus (Tfp) assembly protein ATPase component PilU [mine drainage metagenome]|uniref:Type IV pilus (Tfp) assembly protein ATPase component PilU n=2 Tax=mine drainage metagenome TaxID=410659 RepID=T1AV39_9ZZZZ
MDRDQAVKFVQDLLRIMVQRHASDLFITADFPPAMKIDGEVKPVSDRPFTAEQAAILVRALLNDRQSREFDASKEVNFAIAPLGIGRFRVSAFVEQGRLGAVLRTINTQVPTIRELELPQVLESLALTKRGLILVVGATGSGKSTTLAAMIHHHNTHAHDHIVTIEDPIEYVHNHASCIVTQRELGIDTESWGSALKNTLRQAPDVILIGEIRDTEAMTYAVDFAETGHLCLSTLHANNANQALDRVINLYPAERRQQLLMDLSLNLKAMISQRLLRRATGSGRVAAMEILINTPLVADLIFNGRVAELKELMSKSTGLGMQTFDQAIFDLYERGMISYEEAIRNADSQNELRLRIKLESHRASRPQDDDFEGLQLAEGAPQSTVPLHHPR